MLRDVAAEATDRSAAVEELDRQLAATIDDARRVGLSEAELEPLTAAAAIRQK